MTFSNFNAHSNELFINLNLLKVREIIKVRNITLVHQILTNDCPPRVSSVFSLNYLQHSHRTRDNTTKGLLARPSFRTFTYGVNSICYQSILQWNEFQKSHPDSTMTKLTILSLKNIYQNHLISSYA